MTMHIRHGDIRELERAVRGSDAGWLREACDLLCALPERHQARILVAEEADLLRAVLGLELDWARDGRLARAAVLVLAVDPGHGGRGIGTRLVRFAEGIARIHGCPRVEMAPGRGVGKHRRCSRGAAVPPIGPA
jgi:ribosomal protein S18 acetylase RimI-like enzyme